MVTNFSILEIYLKMTPCRLAGACNQQSPVWWLAHNLCRLPLIFKWWLGWAGLGWAGLGNNGWVWAECWKMEAPTSNIYSFRCPASVTKRRVPCSLHHWPQQLLCILVHSQQRKPTNQTIQSWCCMVKILAAGEGWKMTEYDRDQGEVKIWPHSALCWLRLGAGWGKVCRK